MPDTGNEPQQRSMPPVDPKGKDEDEQHGNRLALGFAIFIPIGIALGLTVFDNVGLGVAAGLGMGSIYSIVAGKSAD